MRHSFIYLLLARLQESHTAARRLRKDFKGGTSGRHGDNTWEKASSKLMVAKVRHTWPTRAEIPPYCGMQSLEHAASSSSMGYYVGGNLEVRTNPVYFEDGKKKFVKTRSSTGVGFHG